MHSIDADVLHTALAWTRGGHRILMGTVVRTWGSAPRPPGSLMVIRDDGRVIGSVSGGCIEDDLIARVVGGDLPFDAVHVTTYGTTAEESRRFGLPCGGSVQIVLEPVTPASRLDELLAAVQAHQQVCRQLRLADAQVQLRPALPGDALHFDGQVLKTLHGPRLRLLIIGGGQLSRYLAAMAVMLDYQVTVCEPREEYDEGWDSLPDVLRTRDMPDDHVVKMAPDAATAIVTLTHDPKLDDLALIEALRTPAFYVGAIGSRRNNEARRQRLKDHFDLQDDQLARLHGPVGLNLGGLTPPEIAVSIMAEMTALRRGVLTSGPLSDWSASDRACLLSTS
jgi:xanthine dehydrogenase accessory factor